MAQARKEVEVQNLVVEREQKVEVARKEQEIKVAKGEIERKKQELESSMIKPAHASAYKLTQEAEAAKFATEKEAEAKAAQIKLSGEAEAEAQRLTGKVGPLLLLLLAQLAQLHGTASRSPCCC
jgi:flotillin